MLFGSFWPKSDFSEKDDPESLFNTLRNRAMLAEAKYRGQEIIFFSLDGIDLEKETVSGFIRKDGDWEWITKEFPHLLITQPSRPEERSAKEESFLKKISTLAFQTHGKYEIYQILSKREDLRSILIPTKIIKTKEDIKEFLEEYKNIVIKPSAGSKGKGVYWLSQKDDHIEIYYHTDKRKIGNKKFDNYLNKVMEAIENYSEQSMFIVQKYIHSRNSMNQPFDFRAHVQRNEKGDLVITKTYPRIGKKGSFLSNLSREGATTNLDYFLVYEFPDNQEKIKSDLASYSLKVAYEVDKAYHASLDEVGIDLTMDASGNYWLFEVNVGPETRFHEWERAKNYIGYACYAFCKFELQPHIEKLNKIIEMLQQKTNLLDKSQNIQQEAQLINYFVEGYKSLEESINCCYYLSYSEDLENASTSLNFKFKEAKEKLEHGERIGTELKESLIIRFNEWSEQLQNILSYFY